MMNITISAWALVAGLMTQAVPEGVHTIDSGPIEMCGLTATNVSELREAALASTTLRPVPIGTSRFELFEDENHFNQLVFTTAAETAFPAATCRHTFEEDGMLRMRRSMRCEAGRAECDALFLEFQYLDARAAREMRGEG